MKTILIKPTNSCNLACNYCYNSEAKRKTYLTIDDIELIFSKMSEYYPTREKIQIIWHGGEPLLMGAEFYEKVYELSKKYFGKHSISHSIQTNATLLTKDLIDSMIKSKIFFGLSIDGFDQSHNLHRKLSTNAIKHILEMADYIKKRQGEVGFIAVVTKANIDHLKDIIDYFSERSISLKLNPVIDQDSTYSLENSDIEKYVNLFDYYTENFERIQIKIEPFYSISKTYFSNNTYSCQFGKSCVSSFLGISPDGNVYPCARFEESEFILGNIKTDSLLSIVNNERREELINRSKNLLNECKKCDYSELCNGGFPHNSYVYCKDYFRKDPNCRFYKALYSKVFNKINNYIDHEQV